MDWVSKVDINEVVIIFVYRLMVENVLESCVVFMVILKSCLKCCFWKIEWKKNWKGKKDILFEFLIRIIFVLFIYSLKLEL